VDVARAEINRLDSIISQSCGDCSDSVHSCARKTLIRSSKKPVRFFALEIKDRDIVVEQECARNLPLLELDRTNKTGVFYT